MKRIIIFIISLPVFFNAYADEQMKFPVFSLGYDGAYGSDEDEDTEELEPYSIRNSAILRIVQAFSKDLILSFPIQYARKDYFKDSDNYYYAKIYPYLVIELSKLHSLKLELLAKYMDYAQSSITGLSKDYTQLGGQIEYSFKPESGSKISACVRPRYYLYENSEKMLASYTFRVSGYTRIDQFKLGGNYNGTVRFPLGSDSVETTSFLNSWGLDLEWDPNRE